MWAAISAIASILAVVVKIWWVERQKNKTLEGLHEQARDTINEIKQGMANGEPQDFATRMSELDSIIRLRLLTRDNPKGK